MNSLFEKQANQSLQEAELRKKLEETKQPTKQKKKLVVLKGWSQPDTETGKKKE